MRICSTAAAFRLKAEATHSITANSRTREPLLHPLRRTDSRRPQGGASDAKAAASTSNAAAVVSARMSVGRVSNRTSRSRPRANWAPARPRATPSSGQHQALRGDQAGERAGLGAEGEANRQLTAPFAHGPRQQPVDANRRQDRGQHGERDQHARQQARAGRGGHEAFIHRPARCRTPASRRAHARQPAGR